MISRTICALGVVLLVGIVVSGPAGAVEYDWTGGADPDASWTNPDNWSPSGYPGQAAGDTAGFDGDASLIANVADLGNATPGVDSLVFGPGIENGGFTVQDTDPLGGALVLGVLEQQSGANVISASLADSGSFSATVSGGSLQLGHGNVDFDITLTDPNGSLRIEDTGLVTLEGDLPNLAAKLSAPSPAGQVFPGGITLERGGGLWLRYGQGGGGVDIEQRVFFEGGALLDPLTVLRSTGSRLTADEEGSDGVVHLRHVSLEEDSYLRIDRQDQGRDELRLTVRLQESDAAGSNSVLIEQWEDDGGFAFDDIYGAAAGAARKTLYLGHVQGVDFNAAVFGQAGAEEGGQDTALTVSLVRAGLVFQAGSSLGEHTVIDNTAPQLAGRLSRVYVNAGRDGNAADYLEGGRIDVAHNRWVEVRVRDSDTEPAPTNNVYTPIRFLDDGDPGSVDGLVNLVNDQWTAPGQTYHGTVVLDRIELAPGAYGGVNANLGNQDRYGVVNRITVLGTQSEATFGVWSHGSGAGYNQAEIDPTMTPIVGMQHVGLLRLGDIAGEDPGNLLKIRGQVAQNQGKRFRMEGELGIDVALNPGDQTGFGTHFVPGFDLGGHTLTMDTPAGTNAGDYRIWTDPGAGTMVKHGGDELDIYWGHNNTPSNLTEQEWNTVPGALEIELTHNSGLQVFVDEGMSQGGVPIMEVGVNQVPATILVSGAQSVDLKATVGLNRTTIDMPNPLADYLATPGEVWLHKLVLGPAAGVELHWDADGEAGTGGADGGGAKVFIQNLNLGPSGTLDVNGVYVRPDLMEVYLDQELDLLVGSGSIVDAHTILLTPGAELSPGGAGTVGRITVHADPATGSFETSTGTGPGQEDGLTYEFDNLWSGPGSEDVAHDVVEVNGGTVYLGDYWTLRLAGNEPPRPSDELTVFEYDLLSGTDLSRVKIDPGTTGWEVDSATLVDDFAGRIYLTGVNQGKANELDLEWISTTDGLWTTASRWDGTPAIRPTALTTAVKAQSSKARVTTAGQKAHRLLIEAGTVEVAGGGSLEVTTNVDISGGTLSVLSGGSFSAGAVNLSGTGAFSIQQDVTLRHLTADGPDAVINTGSRQVQITERMQLGGGALGVMDLKVSAGNVGLTGSDLVDSIDEIVLNTTEAVLVSGLQPGLDGTYYRLNSPNIPNNSNIAAVWASLTPDRVLDTRVDANIDFANGGTWPQAEYVAIEWNGVFYLDSEQTIAFGLNSDDGSIAWIDGQQVVNYDGLHAASGPVWGSPVTLAAGYHTFNLKFYEWTGGESVRFYWDTDAGAQIVPASAFFYNSGLADMSSTAVTVTATSTLELASSLDFGVLTIADGQSLGLMGLETSFASTTVSTSARLENEAAVHLTRTGGLSSGGVDVALTKAGSGEAVLSLPSTIGPGSTVTIEDGTLTLGGPAVLPSAPVTLQGGELRLSSIGSPASLDFANAVSVAGDAAVRAAKSGTVASDDGPLTMTLSQGLSVAPAAAATIGSADDYRLTIGGAVDDGAGGFGGGLVVDGGTVALDAGGKLQQLQAAAGATLSAAQPVILSEELQLGYVRLGAQSGTFEVEGALSPALIEKLTLNGPASVVEVLGVPWQHQTIGTTTPGQGASFNEAAGEWTISASGRDIWDGSDGMYFVFQEAPIDMPFDLRVEAGIGGFEGGDNGWSKAVVMIRDSLAPESKNAATILARADGNGLNPQIRRSDGAATDGNNEGAGIRVAHGKPAWLRLEYLGDGRSFFHYYSDDGTNWISLNDAAGVQTMNQPMTDTMFIGIGVTAHNDAQVTTTRFSNLAGFMSSGVKVNVGTLLGAGTFRGSMDVANTLAPGPGISGINVEGDFGLSDATVYAVELSGNATDGTTSNDLVAVTGTLDLRAAGESMTLDWVPGADATSKFGGAYVVATADTVLGQFDPADIGGGNIGDAYISDVTYDNGEVAVELYDLLDGDGNLDGSANGDDLSLVAGAWLGAGAWGDGDFNFDGTVDGDDLSLLAANWNTSVGGGGGGMTLPAAAVPEPGSLVLLLGAAAAALAFAWRRRG